MKNLIRSDPQADSLYRAARESYALSYSPYSGFAVSAALLGENGQIHPGANVENASYGLSMCAERTAIYTGLLTGAKKFKAVGIYIRGEEFASPCGACLQVMAEFLPPTAEILLFCDRDEFKRHRLSDFLPLPFHRDLLGEKS